MDENFHDIFCIINQYLLKSEAELQNIDTEDLNYFMRTIKRNSHSKTFIHAFENHYSSEQRKILGRHLLTIECVIEKKSIEDYLNSHTEIIDEKLVRCAPDMIEEGIALGLNSESHLLLIGSGAMPISGVILNLNFQCAVTCLDFDQSALNISREWVKKSGIINDFTYLCCDIFKLTDFSSYTHLLITGHIINKDGLLKYLSRYINNQKILLRNSVGLYQSVYGYTTDFSGYEILQIVNHGLNMPYHSLILKHAKPIINDISTPYYEFSLETIKRNYEHMCHLLDGCDKVFYALKANGARPIIESMKDYNLFYEVCSEGEFETVRSTVGEHADIICSLPVKSEELILKLYNNGCRYFVFDSWEEYRKLKRIAPDALKILRIKITDLSVTAIAYGMSDEDFESGFNKTQQDIVGVTFYNIPNTSKEQLTLVLNRCARILEQLSAKKKLLNIGGNYRFEQDLESGFYPQFQKNLLNLKSRFRDLMIYAELGRTIVKSAGRLVTKIAAVQKQGNIFEVFLDSGIPSGILYPPKGIALLNLNRPLCVCAAKCRFYGITCSKKLLFEFELNFIPAEKDILILEEMGTYSLCKANHFHGWEHPKALYF